MPRCVAYNIVVGQCDVNCRMIRRGLSICSSHWVRFKNRAQNLDDDGVRNMVQEDYQRKEAEHHRRRAAPPPQIDGGPPPPIGAGRPHQNEDMIQAAIDRRIAALNHDIRRYAGIGDAELGRDIERRINAMNEEIGGERNRGTEDRELENFTKDRQNVHTSYATKQTKDIIERIMQVEVEKGYKWNMTRCSKTPGEIIAMCRLDINSSRTMIDKYTSKDSISGFGEGIYGRLLDCVWQYIKKSEHKKDLFKILRSELHDNIGMCQQGNLTRLANVLAGYLEGIGSTESIAEILGREFPKLWDINDEDERVAEGNKILNRVGVVEDKVRHDWIGSLY